VKLISLSKGATSSAQPRRAIREDLRLLGKLSPKAKAQIGEKDERLLDDIETAITAKEATEANRKYTPVEPSKTDIRGPRAGQPEHQSLEAVQKRLVALTLHL
jgi:recombinational DNA repair ATPase RecF